ncbi:hypothetical protein AT746_16460 [Lacimicrobium alkaliphilum]|uniref:Uncharacterized protein n=1 Tax=Lacimicrobium alkaliphilum TaxID=1526571 RepID=A0A0U2ZB25_9ALTE|nr:hypothetical protein AT746_16460 [Lacimicrobium alkaliphilum]
MNKGAAGSLIHYKSDLPDGQILFIPIGIRGLLEHNVPWTLKSGDIQIMRHLVTLLLVSALLSACVSAQKSSPSIVSGELQPQQLFSQYPAFEQQYRRWYDSQCQV